MRTIIIGLICVAVGLAADALFLPHQSLWNDEATQMAGLSLDPVEVTRWLANRVDYDFGVPDDRMPPLSYWAGWLWSRATGLTETPMRWLGVACVAIATAIVFATASRTWGLPAGIASSILLATSPNVVSTSVEIRAYPMLILASAGLYACLIGYATCPPAARRRWLIAMLACGIAAMYTHFFGVVAFGGASLAALFLARAEGESVLPVLAAGGLAALAALGLVPFVFASAGLSGGGHGPADGKIVGLVRLAYRLFSHPATSTSRVAVGLAALAFVLAIGCGLAPKGRRGLVAMGLGLALASGAAVVTLAHLAQSAFEAARPSYNVWMLPPLAILMGSGVAARARGVRIVAIAAIVLSVATNLYADAQLTLHGDNFAHTAYGPIARIIRRIGPEEVALIHDGDTTQSWHIYSPTRYEFAGKVRQFGLLTSPQSEDGVRVSEYPLRKSEAVFDPTTLPYSHLIVVRAAQRNANEVATQIRDGIAPLGDGPVTRALLDSGEWERIEEGTYLAFVGADVDVFRKVDRR